MLQTYINGVPYIMAADFKISDMVGNKSTTDVSVLVEDQAIPRAGDIIEIKDADTVIFWGILGIPHSPKFTTGLEWRVYKMTAGNGNSLLACRVINEAFRNYTITQIVTALYNNYIAAEGIALGGIADINIPIKIYSAADFNLQDALNELSDLCSGAWTITADKKFYFSVYEEFPSFPLVIDKTAIPISDFQHTTKAYKQRTVQYISGATNTTIPQTETFTYDPGSGEGFNLSFGVNERPSITINGTAVDPSKIGVAGLDYNDPDIWFTFAYNSKTVTYNSGSQALTSGDEVSITYIGIYSIRIAAENAEKIFEIAELTGTSGRREIVTSLSGVRSQEDATAAANSLLEKFAEATEEITFWLRSQDLYARGLTLDDTNVMRKVTVNIPEWGADGDYIIAERHITALDGDLSEDAEKKLIVSLRLVNRDYMKSYGEILADLKKNVRSLSIRDDEIIVKAYSVNEAETFGESYIVYTMYPNFPVAAASSSSLFAMPVLGVDQYPT